MQLHMPDHAPVRRPHASALTSAQRRRGRGSCGQATRGSQICPNTSVIAYTRVLATHADAWRTLTCITSSPRRASACALWVHVRSGGACAVDTRRGDVRGRGFDARQRSTHGSVRRTRCCLRQCAPCPCAACRPFAPLHIHASTNHSQRAVLPSPVSTLTVNLAPVACQRRRPLLRRRDLHDGASINVTVGPRPCRRRGASAGIQRWGGRHARPRRPRSLT